MFKILLIVSLPFAALTSQEIVKNPFQFDQELSQYAQQKNMDTFIEDPNLINHSDLELINIAREKLKGIVVPDKNFVVTAIRTKRGGDVYRNQP